MRSILSVLLAAYVSVSVLAVGRVGTAEAAFHCVRIHAVMGGYSGNNNIQYVELRADAAFQSALTGHTIQFFDAGGLLKATFTFPAGVTNALAGDSILVGTSEFNANITGGAADFTFTNANTVGANGGDPLHPVQVTGGSIVWAGTGPFACTLAGMPVDAVAYGAGSGGFGTAAVALPASGTTQALRLGNLNTTPANNSTEYSLQNVATSTFTVTSGNLTSDFTTPRNNGRVVLKLNAPSSVGGVAEQPNLNLSAARSSDARGNSPLRTVAAVSGVAAIACVAGWYIYRRRVSRT